MVLRRVLVALVIFTGALSLASPAGAGGSTWEVEPEAAAPGEGVVAGTCVAWAHNSNLGTPGDGPYSLWISPLLGDTSGGVARVPDDAALLGQITVDEGGLWRNCGPNAAHITFTVPDLPPGEYELIHCNDPCTTTLGDITWGVLTVTAADGAPPPTPVPTSDAPPTTSTSALPSTTAAPTTATTSPAAVADESPTAGDDGSNEVVLLAAGDDAAPASSSPAAWWVGGALAVVVLAGWVVVRQR